LQACEKELVDGIVPLVIKRVQFIEYLLRNDAFCMRHSLDLSLRIVSAALFLRDQQVINFRSVLSDLPL
jgi:hypothetical protein